MFVSEKAHPFSLFSFVYILSLKCMTVYISVPSMHLKQRGGEGGREGLVKGEIEREERDREGLVEGEGERERERERERRYSN